MPLTFKENPHPLFQDIFLKILSSMRQLIRNEHVYVFKSNFFYPWLVSREKSELSISKNDWTEIQTVSLPWKLPNYDFHTGHFQNFLII